MRRASAVVFVVGLVFAVALSAQAPPQMPKPGPEQKRLSYFVGNWATEGDMKPSPFGPGGKFSSTVKASLLLKKSSRM